MFEIIQLAHYKPDYYIQSGRHYTFSLKFNTNASIFSVFITHVDFLANEGEMGEEEVGSS